MNPELRQVANGCSYRVMSYGWYDVNGYRFHTRRHDEARPNRTTTNFYVSTRAEDGEYYGAIEEIYELTFGGSKPLKPVVFKCHWFDPKCVRRMPNVGLVEVQRDSVYSGEDVFVVAQQATQVYFVEYPCKDVPRLQGWDVVYEVGRHGVPVPNNEDYNIDPKTYVGEFFQEGGLQGRFEIDLTGLMEDDEDDERVDDAKPADDVDNVNNVELLDNLLEGVYEDMPPLDHMPEDDLDMRDSDDEEYDPSHPDEDDYF